MPALTPASLVPDHATLLDDLLAHRDLRVLLDRLPALGLPDWWLAGPGLAQVVWDGLDGRLPHLRELSCDLLYHQAGDLTYRAEDRVQATVDALTAGLPVRVVARNTARAHLRLEEELGIRSAPRRDARDGIGRYTLTSSCVGITHDGRGGLALHLPHGVGDVYLRRARPNPAAGAARRPGTALTA